MFLITGTQNADDFRVLHVVYIAGHLLACTLHRLGVLQNTRIRAELRDVITSSHV